MTTTDPHRRRRSPRSAHPKGDTVTTADPVTTLHALAEECEAHAQAWDQWHDFDGHCAAWDALHTLLTAAGASVEHLARVRPDLAPVAAEDIAAAYRRLAAHLTVAEGDHHDDR